MVDPATSPTAPPQESAVTLPSARRANTPTTGSRTPRVALAHDWLVGRRGGEFVLERIAKLVRERYTHAGLYTMFDAGKPILPNIDAIDRVTSFVNSIPGAKGPLRRWMLPLYPAAVDGLSKKLAREHAGVPINLLISTSSAMIKGLKAPGGVRHVCYCHAPARYLWSAARSAEYASGKGGSARGLGLRLFGESLRAWDRRTVSHVDLFLANSRHTAKEIERCFAREANVLYPPVRTDLFTPDANTKREEFWLIVTALEPYKRVDLAIDAAMRAGRRLMVVGDGSIRNALKKHARTTARTLGKAGFGKDRHKLIEFMGRVPDEQLRDLYRRAGLFLFPQVEDFGITAVEAQACGCPVLARREGGALDTVLEGRTGAFFQNPDEESIRAAAEKVPENVAEQCRANAERFSEAAFDRRMARVIESAIN